MRCDVPEDFAERVHVDQQARSFGTENEVRRHRMRCRHRRLCSRAKELMLTTHGLGESRAP